MSRVSAAEMWAYKIVSACNSAKPWEDCEKVLDEVAAQAKAKGLPYDRQQVVGGILYGLSKELLKHTSERLGAEENRGRLRVVRIRTRRARR